MLGAIIGDIVAQDLSGTILKLKNLNFLIINVSLLMIL